MILKDFEPKTINDLVWSYPIVLGIAKYINEFPKTKRFLLLYSPPGTGKTTGILAIARSMNVNAILLNASDLKKLDEINKYPERNMDGKRNVLILDEFDGLRRDVQEKILKKISKAEVQIPVIIIANQKNKVIYHIRKQSEMIYVDFDREILRKRLMEMGFTNPIIQGKTLREIVQKNIFAYSEKDFRAETPSAMAEAILSGSPERVYQNVDERILIEFFRRGIVDDNLNMFFKLSKEVPWLGRMMQKYIRNFRGNTAIIDEYYIQRKEEKKNDEEKIIIKKEGESIKKEKVKSERRMTLDMWG